MRAQDVEESTIGAMIVRLDLVGDMPIQRRISYDQDTAGKSRDNLSERELTIYVRSVEIKETILQRILRSII